MFPNREAGSAAERLLAMGADLTSFDPLPLPDFRTLLGYSTTVTGGVTTGTATGINDQGSGWTATIQGTPTNVVRSSRPRQPPSARRVAHRHHVQARPHGGASNPFPPPFHLSRPS